MQLVLDLDGGRAFRPPESGRPPRYFFALLPDADVEPQIHGLAQALHDRLRPMKPPRGLGKYHVTLRGIAVPDGPFGQTVEMARTVAKEIRKASFAIKLNQGASFGTAPKHAFSLTTWEDLPGVNGLSVSLDGALRRAGLKIDKQSFWPHVTVFYDRIARPPIDVPELRWQVHEFVLIESIDRRPYQILGSWPLE